jgi:hypothetical protein
MGAGLVKMGIFDLDLEERLKDAEEDTDLNKVVREIIDYFNSYEAITEANINLGKNYNNILNQVVGAEVD